MGQPLSRPPEARRTISRPLGGHKIISQASITLPSHWNAYKSSSEDDTDDSDSSSTQIEATPVVKVIPAVSLSDDTVAGPPEYDSDGLALKKFPADIKEPLEYTCDDEEIPTPGPSSSLPAYEPTASTLAEAQQQYTSGRGLFWSLAVLKLSPHFLHPVDLTASEFVTFVTADDADSWLAANRPRLLHRVISRRAEAQRALKLAGIPYRQLPGIEMFELMDEAGRRSFIAEYQRHQRNILPDLRDCVDEDTLQPESSSAADGMVRVRTKGDAVVEDLGLTRSYDEKKVTVLTMEKSNGYSSLTRSSSEDNGKAKTLRKHRSVFEALRETFGKYPDVHVEDITHCRRENPSSSSSNTKSVTWAPEPRSRRRSATLRSSVRSLRHLFERKDKAFQRAAIRDHVFV